MTAILGTFNLADLIQRWRSLTPTVRERLVIFGALAGVTLLIVLWAMLLRPKSRSSRSHRHSRHLSRDASSDSSDASGGEDRDSVPRKRRKWRRQRRPHRPLNPTLAQTGGLPPIRSTGPPQPR